MNDFSFFFKWGWDHIISREALDHILFMVVLTVHFSYKEWKLLLWMITAFTIGHSLTLALSVLDVFRLPSNWIEVMIPVTIGITALSNLWKTGAEMPQRRVNYFIILFFGLIHGLGFANAIRFSMIDGQSLGWSLLGFNIGLECGQIFVVLSFLLINWMVMKWAPLKKDNAVKGLSFIVFIISILMVIDRISKF